MPKAPMRLTAVDLRNIRQAVKSEVAKQIGHFPTEKQLDYIEARLKTVLATKADFVEFRSDTFDKLDKIIKELSTMREEQIVGGYQTRVLEERVQALETIHPSGRHSLN